MANQGLSRGVTHCLFGSFFFRRPPLALLIILPIATGMGSFLGGVCAVALEGVHPDATTADWVRISVHILLLLFLIMSPVFELLTMLLALLLLVRVILAVALWNLRTVHTPEATTEGQQRVLEPFDGIPLITIAPQRALPQPDQPKATTDAPSGQ